MARSILAWENPLIDSHFLPTATSFRSELRQYGLQPTELGAEEVEFDGWWTPIANWAWNRPRVGIYFDRLLGDTRRHFWFGFYSTPARIRWLSERVPEDVQDWALVTDADFNSKGLLTEAAKVRIQNSHGLAYEQYSYDDHYFGKYDIGMNATPDDRLVADATDFIEGIVEYVQPKLDLDISEINRRSDINDTTRKQLIDARKGQGAFRRGLFEKWGGCSVTGCTVNDVLRASHIKPWRAASDQERLDVSNGLLLIATLDALFDRGLISFEDNGEMIVSSKLHHEAHLILLPKTRYLLTEPSERQRAYLDSHRKDIFRQPRVRLGV
jgi:HNH endonuclease